MSADSLLATPLIIGACPLDSTHEAWSELGIQTAEAQVRIFEHIEKESIATLASGSPIHKYSKERMHDISVFVGLWQQIVSKIAPVMLLLDKFTAGLLSKVHDDASLQGSLLQLPAGSGSCGDPPDDAQDIKAIAPFIVKHVPLLRILEADHRRENRVVAEEHPEARILNAQIAKLTSSVYSREISLDANLYRSAHHAVKASIAAARAAAEDQRAAAMRLHIANVKQARAPTHPPTHSHPSTCHSPTHSPTH